MFKFAMIIGLLYVGYRLVSKPSNRSIDPNKNELLDDEEFTDYEEID